MISSLCGIGHHPDISGRVSMAFAVLHNRISLGIFVRLSCLLIMYISPRMGVLFLCCGACRVACLSSLRCSIVHMGVPPCMCRTYSV
jgi:hypothetical protein